MVERFLGTLCKRGHDAGGGKSLRVRNAKGTYCAECAKLGQKRYRDSPVGRERKCAYRSTAAYREKEKLAARRRRSNPEYRVEERARGRVYDAKRRLPGQRTDAQRAYMRAYWRRRIQTDWQFLLTKRLRARFAIAMRRIFAGKSYSASRDFDINWAAIIDHLGPCPGPRDLWHVDHIKPLASFNLTDPEQVRLAFAVDNHQWLPARQNISKGTKPWEG